MLSRNLKKLRAPVGRDRARPAKRNADRAVVAGRSEGWSKERDHAPLSKVGNPTISAKRSAHTLRLHLRRDLSRTRQGRWPRPSVVQQRGDGVAPQGDILLRRAGSHAVLMLDQAGWHMSGKLEIPNNITLLPLPAKCPELNPPERSRRARMSGSSCAKTGSPIASFCHMTISSIIAASLGTTLSISRGASCPSDFANGRMGSNH
jgi:hypothetical protein